MAKLAITELENVATKLKDDSEKIFEFLVRLLEIFCLIGEQIIETNNEDLIQITQKVKKNIIDNENELKSHNNIDYFLKYDQRI